MEDAEVVQWYASDELVARTTNTPHPYPKDGGLSYVKDAIEGWKKRTHFKFKDEPARRFRLTRDEWMKRNFEPHNCI